MRSRKYRWLYFLLVSMTSSSISFFLVKNRIVISSLCLNSYRVFGMTLVRQPSTIIWESVIFWNHASAPDMQIGTGRERNGEMFLNVIYRWFALELKIIPLCSKSDNVFPLTVFLTRQNIWTIDTDHILIARPSSTRRFKYPFVVGVFCTPKNAMAYNTPNFSIAGCTLSIPFLSSKSPIPSNQSSDTIEI